MKKMPSSAVTAILLTAIAPSRIATAARTRVAQQAARRCVTAAGIGNSSRNPDRVTIFRDRRP